MGREENHQFDLERYLALCERIYDRLEEEGVLEKMRIKNQEQ